MFETTLPGGTVKAMIFRGGGHCLTVVHMQYKIENRSVQIETWDRKRESAVLLQHTSGNDGSVY